MKVFNTNFPSLMDKTTGKYPSVVFSAGRWNADGAEFGENVAVTDSDSVHVGPGAYTVMNGMTNDISDSYWDKTSVLTPAYNEFQATSYGGHVSKGVLSTEGAE